MTFGEKLLNLRRARNWTQEELADKVGVTRQALSKWEANAALPDTKNVVALAKLFGVTADYLLCEDEGREAETNARPPRSEPRRVPWWKLAGWILLAIGLAGMLAIGLLASVDPKAVNYVTPDGEYIEHLGLAAYLIALNIEWFFALLAATATAGLLLLIVPAIRTAVKKSDPFASLRAETRTMYEKEAAAQRREVYDYAKREIRSLHEKESKKYSEEP